MGASFGVANADGIDAGASVTHAPADWSLWGRFKFAVGGSGVRMIASYRAANINFQFWLNGSNLECDITQGGVPVGITWGISENVEYRVGVRRAAASQLLQLFADTDATPKAGSGSIPFGAADTDAGQHFLLGNYLGATDGSLNGILYEFGWWPGTVLTGAEFAAMGAGTPPGTDPTDYWPLISDAVALFGGHNGTVTGATFVAHSGSNLYSPAPPAAGRFPVGAGFGGRHAVISE